jgi:hypothetical protein
VGSAAAGRSPLSGSAESLVRLQSALEEAGIGLISLVERSAHERTTSGTGTKSRRILPRTTGSECADAIPENDFGQLALFVEEALADELHDAAEQVQELAQGMRSGTSLSDAGMRVV